MADNPMRPRIVVFSPAADGGQREMRMLPVTRETLDALSRELPVPLIVLRHLAAMLRAHGP